jgi:hypothetical protein
VAKLLRECTRPGSASEQLFASSFSARRLEQADTNPHDHALIQIVPRGLEVLGACALKPLALEVAVVASSRARHSVDVPALERRRPVLPSRALSVEVCAARHNESNRGLGNGKSQTFPPTLTIRTVVSGSGVCIRDLGCSARV